MKRQILVMLLAAALVGACTQVKTDARPDPTRPAVKVVGGQIQLDQDPLAFTIEPGKPAPVTVTWRLDPQSGFKFTERGVVIEGRLADEVLRGDKTSVVLDTRQTEIGDCKPADDTGLAFACTNKRSLPGIYKYTLQVTDGKNPLTRDPAIVNW